MYGERNSSKDQGKVGTAPERRVLEAGPRRSLYDHIFLDLAIFSVLPVKLWTTFFVEKIFWIWIYDGRWYKFMDLQRVLDNNPDFKYDEFYFLNSIIIY